MAYITTNITVVCLEPAATFITLVIITHLEVKSKSKKAQENECKTTKNKKNATTNQQCHCCRVLCMTSDKQYRKWISLLLTG